MSSFAILLVKIHYFFSQGKRHARRDAPALRAADDSGTDGRDGKMALDMLKGRAAYPYAAGSVPLDPVVQTDDKSDIMVPTDGPAAHPYAALPSTLFSEVE
jgi:hypothetical protein